MLCLGFSNCLLLFSNSCSVERTESIREAFYHAIIIRRCFFYCVSQVLQANKQLWSLLDYGNTSQINLITLPTLHASITLKFVLRFIKISLSFGEYE